MTTLSKGDRSSKRRNDLRTVTLSKKLSRLLRHRAAEDGIDVDEAGYASVNQILSSRAFRGYTLQDVQHVVEANDKQRFAIKESEGVVYIRANQGHSGDVAERIDPDRLLQRLELSDLSPGEVCVHGTNYTAWKQISSSGLSKMGRQMIHFAVGLPGEEGVISGMRASSTILIYVDIAKAINDGVPFFKSENNVLLSPGVGKTGILPIEYFARVEWRKTGESLFEGQPQRG